ncbi:MAG: flagellar motor protein MotB [Rhodospirillales bacterium]|nr:flagellar motor protein MotB [Rhodospirillales bacterium]MBO6787398.1 flagellar motor protein MotB [Rhodospirillales bacterium]
MWMLTFTDLVSLLLTFFVMLFAMSNVKIDEWDKVIDSLSQTLNPSPEETVRKPTAQLNIGTLFYRRAVNLDYLASVIEENLSNDPLLRDVLIVRLEDRLLVALPGDLLFDPGAAVISERAQGAMLTLGAMFDNVGNTIAVTGHTDPAPPDGTSYASNWELSIARAASVANAIRRGGYDEKIVAFGYADTQYNLLPNLDDADRRRLARRVDIIVMPTARAF